MHTVLLHGASGTARSWQPVLNVLSAHAVHATALDLPGRGASPGPPCTSVASLAQWLLARLEGPTVLVGHSLGGAVALTAALASRQVAGLVLVSSSARLKVSPLILEAVRQHRPEAPFRLDLGFGPHTDPAIVDAYVESTRDLSRATALADWQACDGFDIRADLVPLRIPTVVLYGDADVLTPPRHQVSLAAALGATTRCLPGIGHQLPWETPMSLVDVIRSVHPAASDAFAG